MNANEKLSAMWSAWGAAQEEARVRSGTDWSFLGNDITITDGGAVISINAFSGQLTAPQMLITEQQLPAKIAEQFGVGVSEVQVTYETSSHPKDTEVGVHKFVIKARL